MAKKTGGHAVNLLVPQGPEAEDLAAGLPSSSPN